MSNIRQKYVSIIHKLSFPVQNVKKSQISISDHRKKSSNCNVLILSLFQGILIESFQCSKIEINQSVQLKNQFSSSEVARYSRGCKFFCSIISSQKSKKYFSISRKLKRRTVESDTGQYLVSLKMF